jgi:hypothetical protein
LRDRHEITLSALGAVVFAVMMVMMMAEALERTSDLFPLVGRSRKPQPSRLSAN